MIYSKRIVHRFNRFYSGHFQNTQISRHFSAMLLFLSISLTVSDCIVLLLLIMGGNKQYTYPTNYDIIISAKTKHHMVATCTVINWLLEQQCEIISVKAMCPLYLTVKQSAAETDSEQSEEE